MTNLLVPSVVDASDRFDRSYDIFSMLLKNRIVFLGTAIDQQVANLAVAQVLYLSGESPDQPIHLYISSSGGEVYSGFAIYDAMQMTNAPIYTYAVGRTASMGTLLLAAGKPGHRYALSHATMHMHPGSSGMQGYTEDVRVAFREQERLQTQAFHLLGKHTGHNWKEIEEYFERDRWMHAAEARDYGVVDHVLGDISDVVVGKRNGQLEFAE